MFSEIHSEIQKSIFRSPFRNPLQKSKIQTMLPEIHLRHQTMLVKNPEIHLQLSNNVCSKIQKSILILKQCCSKIHLSSQKSALLFKNPSANSVWVRRVFTVNKNNRRFEFNYSSEESRLHVSAPSIAAAAGTVNPDFSSTSSRFW